MSDVRRAQRAGLGLLAAGCLALAASVSVGGSAGAASAPVTPKLGHVFLIEIENKTFDQAYVSNPNTYLGKTLVGQGQLLTKYYGIGHVSNPNYLAQISGQAPNPDTQSDCQNYTDFQPSPAQLDGNGQAIGAGCVFPANVKTLPDQLTAAGHSWKAYMQDMGNDPTREDDRCGAPGNSFGAGSKDGTQSATATDQYAGRHNPFIYFHSIVDSEACHTNVVPLDQLAGDLAHPADFTWISPNLCSDGHDDPCTGKNEAGGSAGGLKSVDLFLQKYVPMIEASPAFKDDGTLIITSDESDNSDASSCCHEQAGPNSAMPGITGAGGGLIGTLVIGPCVQPGTKNETPYNHYALLRSLEDGFGITSGGSDGKGHLGYAGASGLQPFGTDVFGACAAGTDPGGTSSSAPTSPSSAPVLGSSSSAPVLGSSSSAPTSSSAPVSQSSSALAAASATPPPPTPTDSTAVAGVTTTRDPAAASQTLAYTGGLPWAPVGAGLLIAGGLAAYLRRPR